MTPEIRRPGMTAPSEDKNGMKCLRAAAEPMKEKFGTRRVERFLDAIESARPSLETIRKLGNDTEELLKMDPPEETVIAVTKIIDRMYKKGLDHIIAKLSIKKIAIAYMKRNEEFVIELLKTYKKLSEVNPLLFMGALNDQTFKEMLFFSIEGLEAWVKEGKERFSTDTGANVPEFFRYCMMCAGYDDVGKFKISENAIFLENIKEALTIFAMHKFDRRLIAEKSKSHAPHVKERDEMHLYLPDHVSSFPERTDNEREFFMTTLHEGSHIVKGSFILDVFGIADFFASRGLSIKKVEFQGPKDLRLKVLVVEKNGKEYLLTSVFHLLPLIVDEKHGMYVKHLSNVVEDLRMDSAWLDDKAPGYREDYRRMMLYFLKNYRKFPTALTASSFMEGLLQTITMLSAAEDRKSFMRSLRFGKADGPDKENIEYLLGMDRKVLDLVLGFESDLLMVAGARENNCTRSFLASIRIYDKVKHLLKDPQTNDCGENGENIEGMSGPLSLSDFDPEKVEFSMDPSDGIDMDLLPEDIRNKLRKKMEEHLKNLTPAEKDKLAKDATDRITGEAREAEEERERNKPKPADPTAIHPTGKWNKELVDGVEVRDYCTIIPIRLPESKFLGDEVVASNIRNTARRLMSRRVVESPDALHGEIDPAERREWAKVRRRGIRVPREYHIEEMDMFSRSVSVMVVGDASGSTGYRIANNGRKKIDYILSSMHSLMKGLDGIPGVSTSYGFFDSSGRDNIRYHQGKHFRESMRYASITPGQSNRDGAIIRMMGEALSSQRTDVKIALLLNDSMPADVDENYNGIRGVEDVRHAVTELKKSGILFYDITVPPMEQYYSPMFPKMQDYLDYLYLARNNYSMISTEKELDPAFSAFVKANLPRLRRFETR